MFTDLLNLLINKNRASQSDQILSLSNMNWSDYESLASQEYLGYRISYLNNLSFDERMGAIGTNLGQNGFERLIDYYRNYIEQELQQPVEPPQILDDRESRFDLSQGDRPQNFNRSC